MAISPSEFRKNLYRLLDQVIQTGKPLEITRKGRRLRIVPDKPREGKLSRLLRRDCIRGNPDSLVHVDWSKEWKGEPLL